MTKLLIPGRTEARAIQLWTRWERTYGGKREWPKIPTDEQRCWLVIAALPGTLMPERLPLLRVAR